MNIYELKCDIGKEYLYIKASQLYKIKGLVNSFIVFPIVFSPTLVAVIL